MSKLHIFDMDGTLLRGSACLELSRRLGRLDAISVLEERWVRGEISHFKYWELSLPLWEGLDDAAIDATFAETAWLGGIKEVFSDIVRRGEHSVVITQSPQFFADRLLPWGVETVRGARVEVGVPPEPHLVITPEDKVPITIELIERHGISRDDCVAYGDSASDFPLFQLLPHTVAVNATPSIREIASVAYEGDDLWEAYSLGRSLLEHRRKAAER